MGPSTKPQHAIRRSTRLPLEVPVLVTSLDDSQPLSERCSTTLVNAHGCGMIVARAVPQGIQVRLEIVSAMRHTTARVAEVVPLGGNPETWLVGLELDVPGNFWGIEYAPSDWKVEEAPSAPETPAAATASTEDKAPATESAPRSRRWRLTDISAGACYLETAEPLPANIPILLSIRAANEECLLEGVVRVSHPQTGMGIEFDRAFDRTTEEDLNTKVEGLIARLTGTREVPRIFVGRKETPKGTRRAVASLPSGAGENDVPRDHAPDPLLELIRQGASLNVQQFQNDLRAQRLGKRRDPRIDLTLPVLLTGTDVTGRPLDQRVTTLNISRRGALLVGIHGMLDPGAKVSLTRVQKKEQFRVAWVGAQDTPKAGQIGVAAVDPNSSFWDEVLNATAQSGLELASHRGNDDGSAR